MFQEIIALLIIIFFLIKLFWQKQKGQIQSSEFVFWLLFWLVASAVIIFIKQIDQLVASLGFSGPGIQIVFYLAIAFLVYAVFRIRLRLAKMEKNITKLVEKRAIKEVDK